MYSIVSMYIRDGAQRLNLKFEWRALHAIKLYARVTRCARNSPRFRQSAPRRNSGRFSITVSPGDSGSNGRRTVSGYEADMFEMLVWLCAWRAIPDVRFCVLFAVRVDTIRCDKVHEVHRSGGTRRRYMWSVAGIIIRRRARWFTRPSKHELGHRALGESHLHPSFPIAFSLSLSLSLSLFLAISFCFFLFSSGCRTFHRVRLSLSLPLSSLSRVRLAAGASSFDSESWSVFTLHKRRERIEDVSEENFCMGSARDLRTLRSSWHICNARLERNAFAPSVRPSGYPAAIPRVHGEDAFPENGKCNPRSNESVRIPRRVSHRRISSRACLARTFVGIWLHSDSWSSPVFGSVTFLKPHTSRLAETPMAARSHSFSHEIPSCVLCPLRINNECCYSRTRANISFSVFLGRRGRFLCRARECWCPGSVTSGLNDILLYDFTAEFLPFGKITCNVTFHFVIPDELGVRRDVAKFEWSDLGIDILDKNPRLEPDFFSIRFPICFASNSCRVSVLSAFVG